jgi:hypothetical protein
VNKLVEIKILEKEGFITEDVCLLALNKIDGLKDEDA